MTAQNQTQRSTAASDVRDQFINFFRDKHGHRFVPSSPVVPHDDPTLLFANAGMNQFKPYFLGTETPPPEVGTRVANTQKCIRAGGKHNDLDDVGKDTYHHTFFEMLGNWSFGDYFKEQAIDWAWELLTSKDHWGLDPERLHATYFEGDESEGLEPDLEAKKLWERYLPGDRVHPGNKKDNFWEMGDTGPCGPCSELHYDGTPGISGGDKVNADDPDVIEIWNLVFIQFNRNTDGSLKSLPAKHVDTGMGFERIVRVLQGKDSNYDTDVFTPLFAEIQKVTGARAYEEGGSGEKLTDPINVAYRVIADHVRCLTFALTDGAHCANEGRGYVLRSILRRAVRYGWQTLDQKEPFLYKLVPTVADHMGDAFPELKKNPNAVIAEIKDEEESFGKTLERGIELFEAAFVESIPDSSDTKIFETADDEIQLFFVTAEKEAKLKALEDADMNRGPEGKISIVRTRWYNPNKPLSNELTRNTSVVLLTITEDGKVKEHYKGNVLEVPAEKIERLTGRKLQISGEAAFKLHDTYGFPFSLTKLMAEERGLTVDEAGFNAEMEKAREVSKGEKGGGGDIKPQLVELVQQHGLTDTEFLGYETTTYAGRVNAQAFDLVETLAVYTDKTPFYGEAGGQVGDTGTIELTSRDREGAGAVLTVTDTQKVGQVIFHLCKPNPDIAAGVNPRACEAEFKVDAIRRAKIRANHTSTHMLNRALRVQVNPEADQMGSLVDDEKLRFDFSNSSAISDEQLEKVEQQVNEDIGKDLPVYAGVAPQEDALKINGLRAVFGEKYPPKVRVVSIGAPTDDLLSNPDSDEWADLSIEFCGGTHLDKTGDAEGFVVLAEEAVAKGVRRITALTGEEAQRASAAGDQLLNRLDTLTDAPPEQIQSQVDALSRSIAETTLPLLKKRQAQGKLADLSKKVKDFQKAQGSKAEEGVVDAARAVADAQAGPVIVAKIDGADGKTLRTAMDVVKKRHEDAAILLGAASDDGKVAFMATVPKDMIGQGLKAGDWVKQAAQVCGGGGGGRPDSAQAGGKDPAKLDEALETAQGFANEKF